MIPATEALKQLREGNLRYVADERNRSVVTCPIQRIDLVAGQEPFAIILGCSDSRVPAELVFDQGVGDLFVIRVAGNVVAPSLVGSVEFAASLFHTRLVVVLGHTMCGAIQATIQELERPDKNRSPNLASIVNRIRPCVEPLVAAGLGKDPAELIAQAGRANIRASANALRHGSEILEGLIEHKELVVVGAEYSLETGLVDFFDGVPERS
ncbi:MAG: carbonic anhydrase [Candidatus Omnitrophota bacterium]|jgi:carbonic anhydrase